MAPKMKPRAANADGARCVVASCCADASKSWWLLQRGDGTRTWCCGGEDGRAHRRAREGDGWRKWLEDKEPPLPPLPRSGCERMADEADRKRLLVDNMFGGIEGLRRGGWRDMLSSDAKGLMGTPVAAPSRLFEWLIAYCERAGWDNVDGAASELDKAWAAETAPYAAAVASLHVSIVDVRWTETFIEFCLALRNAAGGASPVADWARDIDVWAKLTPRKSQDAKGQLLEPHVHYYSPTYHECEYVGFQMKRETNHQHAEPGDALTVELQFSAWSIREMDVEMGLPRHDGNVGWRTRPSVALILPAKGRKRKAVPANAREPLHATFVDCEPACVGAA